MRKVRVNSGGLYLFFKVTEKLLIDFELADGIVIGYLEEEYNENTNK